MHTSLIPRLMAAAGFLAAGAASAQADLILTIGSYWPFATTAWDYIHRAMPYSTPGVLAPDQVFSDGVWLVIHADLAASARVRAVADFLADAVAASALCGRAVAPSC